MKKILFGITSLTLGGAERVLVDLANKLCNQYEITIFTIYAKGELEKQLNPKIKRKTLYDKSYLELSKFSQKIGAPLKILGKKTNIYETKIKGDYDIEIAFLEGPITRLLSVENTDSRKIVWIHNDISSVFGKGIKAILKRYIDQKIYQKYQDLIFVSQDNLKKFNEIYRKKESQNERVIYNYINKEAILERAKEPIEINWKKETINLVTVARLVPQKAIGRLIQVHSNLIKKGILHQVFVIGDGPQKQTLKEMIKKEKVENTFHLLGKKENPYPYIQKASYFCLLSEFEGYGMVLEEAKILNKPIIITDTAAREAVNNYKKSIILENTIEKIEGGLETIFKEKKLQDDKESVQEYYDNSEIIDKFIELVGE